MKVRRQNSAENTQGGGTGSPTDGDERRGSENLRDDSDPSFATDGDFTPNSTRQLYLWPGLFSRVTCCFLAAEWDSVSPGPG